MSWVEAELREQPAALARLLAAESENAAEIARDLARADVHYVLIAARGSSDNATRYAQYLFGTVNRLPVAPATPALYTLYEPPLLAGAFAIGISQSGASPDVVEVIAEARRQGRPTLAITNDPASPLAQAAARTLPLHAGVEHAVAATKTYLNSIGALALLSAMMSGDAERLRALRAAPDWVAEQIERSLADASRLDAYRAVDAGSVVARGFNYGTAFEIALKIRELSAVQFEAYSGAELLHGSIAAMRAGRPAVVVAPSGRALAGLRELVETLRARGSELIAISDDTGLLAAADTPLPLARTVPEWLSPLLSVVPGQVAAIRLATLRGADVDRPAGLTKITLTR